MPKKTSHSDFLNNLSLRNTLFPPIYLQPNQVYQTTYVKLKFLCSNNHEFETIPKHITSGHGCPKCGIIQTISKNTVSHNQFIEMLDERNIKFDPIRLSPNQTYSGTYNPLTFLCENNHSFSTTPKSVLRGSGCPTCFSQRYNSLNKIQSLIDENNKNTLTEQIQLLSNSVDITYNETTQFKCSNNHIWDETPKHIINNFRCPLCKTDRKNTFKREKLLQLQQFLLERNRDNINTPIYLVDGEKFKSHHSMMKFICRYNHQWEASFLRITRCKSGCPHCYGNARKTTEQFIEQLSNLNNTRKNKIILIPNQSYVNAAHKLDFECDKKHVWKARPYNIINGYGCPDCSINRNYSFKAIRWLEYIINKENIKILHAENGGEYRIPNLNIKVDGYCKETNTVYEFLGNYWHGNPNIFDQTDINVNLNKTYGLLYEETSEREELIKNAGFNLISIWEEEWDVIEQFNGTVNDLELDFIQELTKLFSNVEYTQISLPNNLVGFDVPKLKTLIVFCSFNKIFQQCTGQTRFNINITKEYEKKEYKTIQIYEDEWKDDKILVLKKINHLIGDNLSVSIFARKCDIRLVSDSKVKSAFLNKNHIQGNDTGQINIGAYYQDTLVALMTFCKPRVVMGNKSKNRDEDYSGIWELSRFTTDINYRIPGIASKILTYFKNNYVWKNIFSFADKRWSEGKLYNTLGFSVDIVNPPDYFYIVNGVRKHRWNYRKHALRTKLQNYDINKTEYQNMLDHGFDRIWDCGTIKFIVNNDK